MRSEGVERAVILCWLILKEGPLFIVGQRYRLCFCLLLLYLICQGCNLLTIISSRNKRNSNTLYSSLLDCLRRRELNACGEKRTVVKTGKQQDTQTYLVKWTNRQQKLDENYTYIWTGKWIESSKRRKLQNALNCTKRNFKIYSQSENDWLRQH